VAIDRAATLRNAEKLIRQGKLDAGIAEYLRVVEDAPGDWNAKNALGDLYARAGQVDKAIEQFLEIANNLNDEGGVAKAGAVYKKILKLKPDHEQTLLQLSEILGSQRLFVDARAHLNTVIELRRSRNDTRGALQAKIRLGTLDPEDYPGRMAAVSARIEMGDKGGAFNDLKDIAGELAEKGRAPEAVEALREAQKLNPDDEEIKEKLLDVHVAAGDLVHARECATTVEQFRMVAAAFEATDNPDEALETLRQGAKHNPHETELAAQLARAFIARGDLASAAEYLTLEAAGNDPELLLTVANIQLRGEKLEDGLAIVRKLLEEDPSRREMIAVLGWSVAEQRPDAGFSVVELAADTAVAQVDWPGAAAVLQEFVTRVPNHVSALMRLVEICVDGGLEATMYSAQAQLADAYIAAGAATEARFIAEDLVAREPWDKSNIERFRRALVLLGEPDPDALIAQRLSGESPFTSTDLFATEPIEETPPEPEPAPPSEEELADLVAAANEADDPVRKPKPARKRTREETGTHFQLSANAIDLDSILGDFDAPPPPEPAGEETASEDTEVDLSVVLNEIKPTAVPLPSSGAGPGDLDGVFGKMRDQATTRSMDELEKEYKRGLALRDAGDIDGCIKSMEKASRAPKLRFAATWLIGRLYRERDMLPQSLEWLEQAAQASAPDASDANRLLFELADTLEKVGEVARALAVCLELQAETGDYEDVAERIDRLSKVQA
jgi:tetratricopeptide (TPR) repeat protein